MKHGFDTSGCLYMSNYKCFPAKFWGKEGETHGSLGVDVEGGADRELYHVGLDEFPC